MMLPVHGAAPGVEHVPALHVPCGTSWVPEQVGPAPQATVGNTHAPSARPPHDAAHTPAPLHAVGDPCGAPEGTGEQVPSSPVRSQAKHEPVHAVSQHMPSGLHVVPPTHPAAVVAHV